MTETLAFYPILGSFTLCALLAGVLIALVLCLPPRGVRLSARGYKFIICLRLAAILLLLLLMLRPTLVSTQAQRLSATVYLLLDSSESMSIGDEAAGATRFHFAREMLANAAEDLARLAQKTELLAWTFDETITPQTISVGKLEKLPAAPKGTSTAIGAALEQVRALSSGKRILGTILLSDGNQRSRAPQATPDQEAIRYRNEHIPLYTICFGQPTGSASTQDVALEDVQTNETVFLGNEVIVTGAVRVSGFLNKAIEVTLALEDASGNLAKVDSASIVARGDGESMPFRLVTAPSEVGVWKYVVQAAEQPHEIVITNNTQAGFVRVIEGGVRVLLLEGRRRFEQKWIRQALDASTDIAVETWSLPIDNAFAARNNNANNLGALQRLTAQTAARPSQAQTLFTPGKFDVFIIDNVDAAALHSEEIDALTANLQSGAGLLMLGGTHAFGAGGYAETSLAATLPVTMSSLDRQRDDENFRGDVHWSGEIPMLPTEIGRTHPVMHLNHDGETNLAQWKLLPSLDGANRLTNIKPGALILAQGDAQQPLLVLQLYGNGRVVAFAGDSTWRWVLGGHGDLQKRFWRQLILWLAQQDDLAAGECRLIVETMRITPREAVPFKIVAKDGFGARLTSENLIASCVLPDGSRIEIPTRVVDDANVGSATQTQQVGDYFIEAAVPFPDGTTQKTSGRFIVAAYNAELENPVAQPRLLERIAKETSARSVLPEEFAELLRSLEQEADALVELRQEKWSLYDTYAALILFISLIGLEWIIRKKQGLI